MLTNNRIKGIIYLFITAFIWGGSFISQLIGGNLIGSFTFSAYRCSLGCITILIMIYVDNFLKFKKIIFFRNDEKIVLTIKNSLWCGFTLFLAMIIQQIGVEITDAAKSGLITSLEIICVPILMLILFKRKIKLITWIFIFLSMVGIMLLGLNSISGINYGDALVFISTILYSYTIIQIQKYIEFIDPLKFSFFRFVVVSFLSFILANIFKENLTNIEHLKMAIPSILYSGVLSSGIAYTFSILGQKNSEPVIATLIMSLEGIFAAIFGWILLGQTLNFLQIIGIIITFISISIVEITDFKH